MVNCVRTSAAAAVARAALAAPACWGVVEWCSCLSLEQQRDKSHSRYWSAARFSGLSRILNHKAALSGSFISLVFADAARMKPMAQKQPGAEQGEKESQQSLPKGKMSHLTTGQGTPAAQSRQAERNLIFKVCKSLQKTRGLGCSQEFGKHI